MHPVELMRWRYGTARCLTVFIIITVWNCVAVYRQKRGLILYLLHGYGIPVEDHPQTVTQYYGPSRVRPATWSFFYITVGQHPGWAFKEERRSTIWLMITFRISDSVTPISSITSRSTLPIVKQLFFAGTAIPEGIFHRRHNIGYGDDQYGFTA